MDSKNPDDWGKIALDDVLAIEGVRNVLLRGNHLKIIDRTNNESYKAGHEISRWRN